MTVPFEGVSAAVKALSEHAVDHEVRRLLRLAAEAIDPGTRAGTEECTNKQRGLIVHMAQLEDAAGEEWFDFSNSVALTKAHIGYVIAYLKKEIKYEEIKNEIVDCAYRYRYSIVKYGDGDELLQEAFSCIEDVPFEDTSQDLTPADAEYLRSAIADYLPVDDAQIEEFVGRAQAAGATVAHADAIEGQLGWSYWQNYGKECLRCGNTMEDEGDVMAYDGSELCSWCLHMSQKDD